MSAITTVGGTETFGRPPHRRLDPPLRRVLGHHGVCRQRQGVRRRRGEAREPERVSRSVSSR